MPLRVTLLGTGTSHGVPTIACDCPVCTSPDPRNRRHRTAAYLELPGGAVLIDTPPELRLQALTFGLRRVDAVLLTHTHADHIAGLDDLRRFNELAGGSIPVYGHREAMADIRARWHYIFDPTTQGGGGKPDLTLCPVEGPFPLLGETVIPIPARHGRLLVYGYRIRGFAYLTDCSELPPSSRELLRGLEVLVLGAIRRRPHETHFNLEQALAVVADVRPLQTFFTHLTHELDYETTNRELPPEVALAYDGLVINCS
ncbi:MAG: MBL fold metallo-hydrolase [Firmicutes bacterium]|nr:MBL fold metallo-hydrolase [Bacillota bacterium]